MSLSVRNGKTKYIFENRQECVHARRYKFKQNLLLPGAGQVYTREQKRNENISTDAHIACTRRAERIPQQQQHTHDRRGQQLQQLQQPNVKITECASVRLRWCDYSANVLQSNPSAPNSPRKATREPTKSHSTNAKMKEKKTLRDLNLTA